MNDVQVQMPQYQCHKKVGALKIKEVILDVDLARRENRETTGGATIVPEENSIYASFKVDREYVHKHNPQAGGYYVVYEGGYKSWSPADAFESGYTKIEA